MNHVSFFGILLKKIEKILFLRFSLYHTRIFFASFPHGFLKKRRKFLFRKRHTFLSNQAIFAVRKSFREKARKNVNFPKKQLTNPPVLLYTIILKVSADLTGKINGLLDFGDKITGRDPHFAL